MNCCHILCQTDSDVHEGAVTVNLTYHGHLAVQETFDLYDASECPLRSGDYSMLIIGGGLLPPRPVVRPVVASGVSDGCCKQLGSAGKVPLLPAQAAFRCSDNSSAAARAGFDCGVGAHAATASAL